MLASIYHSAEPPYAFPLDGERLKIRIRMKKNEAAACLVMYADRFHSPGLEAPQAMELIGFTRHFDYYETVVRPPGRRLRYQFYIRTKAGESVWYGERGASGNRGEAGYFQYAYICDADIPQVPDWLHEAVVYQIFPDRFRNGDPANDPAGTLPWTADARPGIYDRFGGDLQGVIDKLPYLAELGVNTLYLTPVFASPSNHKYDTADYLTVDPTFGDNETLKRLVGLAHGLGMRVILDAVFNHSGDRFFAFRDVMERGEESAYKDWFFVKSYPVVQSPAPSYATFSHAEATMPKLNTAHPDAARYLLDVARYWLDYAGIDGWRLDVANEVDHRFWRRLRSEVKERYPDAALIGEIMHQSAPWLRGDQFDGVMNYLFRETMLDYFARQTIGATAFVEQLTHIAMSYTDQANAAMLQLLGSHDTERFLTACRKYGAGWHAKETAEARMMLAVCLQFAYPGMPMIYYGDEAGMEGDADPDCRRPMLWDEAERSPRLFVLYKELIALRRRHPALTRGSFRLWFADEARNALGFVRASGDDRFAVVINNAQQPFELQAALPFEAAPGLALAASAPGGATYRRGEGADGGLVVGPYGCAMLRAAGAAGGGSSERQE